MTSNSVAALPDLALSSNGGKVLFATDDFFEICESLLLPADPVFDVNAYVPEGKLMDGWETRRKRAVGHDFCIIKLGFEGIVEKVLADTAYFTGNHVPAISIQAISTTDEFDFGRIAKRGTCATQALIEEVDALSKYWTEILPFTKLQPGYPETRLNHLSLSSNVKATHIRLNYYPDGGMARLRVYGTVVPNWDNLKGTIDLAALKNGGKALEFSNAHYGHPMRMLAPNRSTGMHDGWETARNLNRPSIFKMVDGMIEMVGKDYAVIALGHSGVLEKVLVDTNHYKGNYPESCLLEYSTAVENPVWKTLVDRVKLSAHKEHEFGVLSGNERVSLVKITIFPDGGVSRLRVFGKI